MVGGPPRVPYRGTVYRDPTRRGGGQQDDTLVTVTAMPEFSHLSTEELRFEDTAPPDHSSSAVDTPATANEEKAAEEDAKSKRPEWEVVATKVCGRGLTSRSDRRYLVRLSVSEKKKRTVEPEKPDPEPALVRDSYKILPPPPLPRRPGLPGRSGLPEIIIGKECDFHGMGMPGERIGSIAPGTIVQVSHPRRPCSSRLLICARLCR